MTSVTLLLVLVACHFLCDYTLQTDGQARGKSMFTEPLYGVQWYYWNASHAATHALAIGLATQSPVLGLIEFVLHFAIDAGKSAKIYNLHTDQAMHIVCKMAYVAVIASGEFANA